MYDNIPEFEVLPQHIGFIMDGNGRWAKMRGLERSAGHKEGAKTFRKICEYCADVGVKHMTFYAFERLNRKTKRSRKSDLRFTVREESYLCFLWRYSRSVC